MTASYNVGEDHGMARLTKEDILEIAKMRRHGYRVKVIADEFGVSKNQVYKILRRQSWTHVTKSKRLGNSAKIKTPSLLAIERARKRKNDLNNATKKIKKSSKKLNGKAPIAGVVIRKPGHFIHHTCDDISAA